MMMLGGVIFRRCASVGGNDVCFDASPLELHVSRKLADMPIVSAQTSGSSESVSCRNYYRNTDWSVMIKSRSCHSTCLQVGRMLLVMFVVSRQFIAMSEGHTVENTNMVDFDFPREATVFTHTRLVHVMRPNHRLKWSKYTDIIQLWYCRPLSGHLIT